MAIEKNKSLKEYTSWQVGGCAKNYVAPQSVDQLKQAILYARDHKLRTVILGGGTNVLISDEPVEGLVIHTHKLSSVQILEENENVVIEALAGTPKSEVLKIFMKLRLQPAVFLAGLPGDMAGGVVMNAGVGHKVEPKEFEQIVHSFDVLEIDSKGQFKEKTFTHEQIDWHYRKSKNWQPGIITKVRVTWPNEPSDEVLKQVRLGNKRRKDSQPLTQPSCGSVFKNPPGDHSGRLIEACGLKGHSIGGAQVSEKHANFIVNTGAATAHDIDKLIKYVQKVVKETHGLLLTNEVVYLGSWKT